MQMKYGRQLSLARGMEDSLPSPRTVKNSKAVVTANAGSLGMGTVYLIVPPITTKGASLMNWVKSSGHGHC